MKGKNLSIMAMIAAVFCSCGQQPAQERGPRPVKLAEVKLKSTDLTIQEIAYSLNFPDISFFGKYFKRYTGMSPKQYRENG
jgi:transcriptional regulator GlxA family with amidase domain